MISRERQIIDRQMPDVRVFACFLRRGKESVDIYGDPCISMSVRVYSCVSIDIPGINQLIGTKTSRFHIEDPRRSGNSTDLGSGGLGGLGGIFTVNHI